MEIGQLLVTKGLITREQLAEAKRSREGGHLRLDQALIKLGYISEQDLLAALSEHLSMPVVNLSDTKIERRALNSMPAKLVYRNRLLPVQRENGTLHVAMSDPFDLYALDEVRMLTGLNVEPVLAAEEDIDRLIKSHFGVAGDTIDQMVADESVSVVTGDFPESEDLLEAAQEASVIKLVNELFLEAIQERASDIHIEPYEDKLSVRYRIDGVLHDATLPPEVRRFQHAIVSRVKILADLNISEKRLPQDGRIKLQIGGRQVDIRVSVIPMLFGEGVVMRVLDKSAVLFDLPQLGMGPDHLNIFNDQIAKPHGIILVTGPTGSGKTTTLYAALQSIVNGRTKVLTVEDPVEYHLDGVNQIQVLPKVGLTFARGLRAILRHDPDVVMIGEIRDKETAEAAIQAALTGHLVLSTLHTNDACSAATRLIDMGIEPFLVASTLNAAMAQRLVRTICPDCKQPYQPSADELPDDFHIESGQTLYRGAGCRRCRSTGYRGRAGLFELMTVDDAVRDRIGAKVSTAEIAKAARQGGLRLLREDGWEKVRQGLTTPSEVLRCTQL